MVHCVTVLITGSSIECRVLFDYYKGSNECTNSLRVTLKKISTSMLVFIICKYFCLYICIAKRPLAKRKSIYPEHIYSYRPRALVMFDVPFLRRLSNVQRLFSLCMTSLPRCCNVISKFFFFLCFVF